MVAAGGSSVPKLPQHHVDSVQAGSVVVIASPKVNGAVWGGLMSTRAQYLGAQGLVTDGRCRDLEEHRGIDFPVFAAGISCCGAGSYVIPAAVGVPVCVAGVTVKNGDIVVGDLNGVMVIPLERLEEVVVGCEKAQPIEHNCMQDLKAGKGIQETFAKHRGK
jgi:regulator of RNase E activity RraA